MSKVIRLSQNLVMHARRVGRLEGRLPFQQIEHWTRLGKLAENNLELTGQMLLDILNTQSPEL
ncbi:TA system antitoxin ParD family protein [Polynucleobacter hallstattensis]|jgi:ParD-like antitoxin of type II bacterial toxin-antitoxin system|uniref:TA system antitoxin ParD family protein n=1 Tax=Polynucleobacter hallstattensis TaxID=1855586 RepID=UPI001C0CC565|nr:ParD-like family protein [Polynucleobacter hallstattensis]MBU3561632.1 hypothetical protein [Polynucleobacter hallstattensis]